MKKEWIDSTSYSQSDLEKKPTCWSLKTKSLRIIITCGHIYYKGEWIMHCFDLGIKEMSLFVKTKEEAKKKSINIVKNLLNNMLKEIV